MIQIMALPPTLHLLKLLIPSSLEDWQLPETNIILFYKEMSGYVI